MTKEMIRVEKDLYLSALGTVNQWSPQRKTWGWRNDMKIIKVRYDWPSGNPCKLCCFKYLDNNCKQNKCQNGFYFKRD